MSRLVVYRVEHVRTGDGPFGAESSQALRDAMSAHCARWPALIAEIHELCPEFRPDYHFCGLLRLSLVNEWFGPFQQELTAAGFSVFAYEPLVSNVLRSSDESQVAFARYAPTPRRQLPWPALAPTQLTLFA